MSQTAKFWSLNCNIIWDLCRFARETFLTIKNLNNGNITFSLVRDNYQGHSFAKRIKSVAQTSTWRHYLDLCVEDATGDPRVSANGVQGVCHGCSDAPHICRHCWTPVAVFPYLVTVLGNLKQRGRIVSLSKVKASYITWGKWNVEWEKLTLRCPYLLFQGVDPQLASLLLLPDCLHLVGEAADLLAVNLPFSPVVTAHLQRL